MKFKNLYEFIDIAEKNRKYLPNTATNYRTPLRLVESELTDEEKNSTDLVKTHLNDIFTLLYSKNSTKLSASSLEVYKRRVRSLISDYEQYGTDPTKIAAWDRKALTRKPKVKKAKEVESTPESLSTEMDKPTNSSNIQSAELNLSRGKGKIIVPQELSEEDRVLLKFQIDVLAKKIPKEVVHD